jgi:hypothetical protein
MEARTTRRPGQKGTKRLMERFGDRLLFVRYRYDPAGRRRVTTVEIIVDEAPWAANPDAAPAPPPSADPGHCVALRIAVHELNLRAKVKAAGGKWDPARQVWILPMRRARVLGLQDRILPPGP